MKPSHLPIHTVIPELLANLASNDDLILEAPPGAGKTTVVPLALLNAEWLQGKKILMLEPRRLAARNAAQRMADTLGEKVGETVGYRIRLETKVTSKTRIEVITEGILARLIQDDPSLDDYAIVIFDEFHERSLHADLGLSLSLHGRELFSDLRQQPLKLLVMSATLNGKSVRNILPTASLVQSEGRAFSVEVRYREAFNYTQDIVQRVTECVQDSLARSEGSQLVFLPGQAEIQRVNKLLSERLATRIASSEVVICPLYGALNLQQQRAAIEPASTGQIKIVLATNIAETSLTINGVKVVVDSGLGRSAVFDLASGLTTRATHRISKASATQRAGRAGRTAPGVCYRLWSEEQHFALREFDEPELMNADLAPVVMQLLQMGVEGPEELQWLDQPKPAAIAQAYDLLQRLHAVERAENGLWRLTTLGSNMAELPVHPRLAAILVWGVTWQVEHLACELVALLSERDVLIDERDISSDLHLRVLALRGEYEVRHHQKTRIKQLHAQVQQLRKSVRPLKTTINAISIASAEEHIIGLLLCVGFPDRVAKQRSTVQYVLSNGKSAKLSEADPLAKSQYLVAANVGGSKHQASDTLYLAATLAPDMLEQYLPHLLHQHIEADWDVKTGRFIAEKQQRIGQVAFMSEPLDLSLSRNRHYKQHAITALIEKKQWSLFDRSAQFEQWLGRVKLVAQFGDVTLPALSDPSLLALLSQALETQLDNITKLEDFKRMNVVELLQPQLNWQLVGALKTLTPERYRLPSGKFANIDYTASPPVISAKLQWFFGCAHTPSVCDGKQPLLVHLLSPAQRPLQVTQDLAGFWSGSYHAVKKDMKGRYPKHAWPDDPEKFIET